MPRLSMLIFGALMLAAPMLSNSQTSAADPVLVETGTVKIYRSEYDAALLKLRADVRAGFGNSPRRVGDLLMSMLIDKTLAAQARERKIADTPENAARLRLEVDRTLAQLRIADVEEAAVREFDARMPQ